MALTKVNRGGLNTGISDSSDATAITIDSSENITTGGGVTVTGDIDIANKLIHTGDDNTHIAFTTDQVNITAGNENTIQCNYNNVVINEDGADINFRVEGDSLTNLFVCDAGQEAIAMGDANPTRHSKATRLLCYNGSGTGTDFALH